jgi:hypothetical protein
LRIEIPTITVTDTTVTGYLAPVDTLTRSRYQSNYEDQFADCCEPFRLLPPLSSKWNIDKNNNEEKPSKSNTVRRKMSILRREMEEEARLLQKKINQTITILPNMIGERSPSMLSRHPSLDDMSMERAASRMSGASTDSYRSIMGQGVGDELRNDVSQLTDQLQHYEKLFCKFMNDTVKIV